MSFLPALFLTLFLGFGNFALANTKASVKANTKASAFTAPVSTSAVSVAATSDKQQTQTDIDFGLRYDSYFKASDSLPASEMSFQMQLNYHAQDTVQARKMQIIFGGYPKNNSTYLAAPEIYFQPEHQAGAATTVQVTYGRRIFFDSAIDREFNLGVVNPFLTQDRLQYTAQGLMGLHAEVIQKYWSLRLAYLPLYIPNQVPSVKEESGKIVTANRWGVRPPTQFAFNNQNKAIVYSITDYKVQDIIFNDGVSATARLGNQKEMPYFLISYSRKPINEIGLTRETYANLNIVGQVFLSPVVLYTKNLTADLRYETDQAKWFISYIQDNPENQTAPAYHSIQKLEGLHGWAVGGHFDMTNIFNWPVHFGLATAKLNGGEIQDINSDGTQNLFTFTKSRILFREPTVSSLSFALNRAESVKTDLKWLYDQEQKGSILSMLLGVQPVKAFNIQLGVDILGTDADDSTSAQAGQEFLQQYQANDRVYGGMQYVF